MENIDFRKYYDDLPDHKKKLVREKYLLDFNIKHGSAFVYRINNMFTNIEHIKYLGIVFGIGQVINIPFSSEITQRARPLDVLVKEAEVKAEAQKKKKQSKLLLS